MPKSGWGRGKVRSITPLGSAGEEPHHKRPRLRIDRQAVTGRQKRRCLYFGMRKVPTSGYHPWRTSGECYHPDGHILLVIGPLHYNSSLATGDQCLAEGTLQGQAECDKVIAVRHLSMLWKL